MENKKADNEESLLEDNENFLSLEELSEDELPTFQEDVFGDMDKDFFNKRFNDYFKQIYNSDRNFEIAKKFYGIGQESKSLTDLAKEYSLSVERIRKIVLRPLLPAWKQSTVRLFNSI